MKGNDFTTLPGAGVEDKHVFEPMNREKIFQVRPTFLLECAVVTRSSWVGSASLMIFGVDGQGA